MYILLKTHTGLRVEILGVWHDHHQDRAQRACRDACNDLGIHAVRNGNTMTHYGTGIKMSGSMRGVSVQLHKVTVFGDDIV